MPLLVLAAALILAVPALSQEDLQTVPTEPFTAPRRLPAVFPHDAHNEKAGLSDCTTCHHGEKDGKIDTGADSTGTPCVECHPVNGAKGRTPLMRAYHRQCAGCHMDGNKGPVTCGACHKPS